MQILNWNVLHLIRDLSIYCKKQNEQTLSVLIPLLLDVLYKNSVGIIFTIKCTENYFYCENEQG